MFGAFTGILLLFMIQNVLTLAGVPRSGSAPSTARSSWSRSMVSRITGGKAQE